MIAADISRASLRLGQRFKRQHALDRVYFVQADLFGLPFVEASFDCAIANGVLHHTADPAGALVRLVRPGGHVVVGLYNRLARLPLRFRRALFAITGGRFRRLDPVLRTRSLSDVKRQSWYRDQYEHPHEVSVSVDQALDWFERSGVRYVSALPSLDGTPFPDVRLFAPSPRGTLVGRWIRQLGWAWTHGHEGGLFVLVGRREN